MENNPMHTHGTFSWNELSTNDLEKAKSFYSKTIGWTIEEFPMAGGAPYLVAKMGDQYVGGITSLAHGPLEGAKAPYWFAYLQVDDVDARVAAATKHGATVLRPAFDVPNVGRIAVLRDAGGATVGWMTSVPAPVPA
jgi:predicted enzyme related to lactoylglutathione lyase